MDVENKSRGLGDLNFKKIKYKPAMPSAFPGNPAAEARLSHFLNILRWR